MNWDALTLTVLAVFGAVVLLLNQVHDLLARLPDLINAWHRVRRAWRDAGGMSSGEVEPPGGE
ncbi:hypothetical protein [Streptomyces chartreusis]|uniref:hypothetical protein n=1 Tax=Streptomyces chartreusis TaxID=1969 RepID=UPI003637E8F7